MLFVLSPAKALDMAEGHVPPEGVPEFGEKALKMAEQLAQMSKAQLQALLEVSGNLADLNSNRYKSFKEQPCKAAALAYNGDAYIGWAASTMSEEDLRWAQRHVRILSGLYGVLRPLDPIQAYRLSMGTKLKTEQGKNLYEFWGDQIARSLGKVLEEENEAGEGDSFVLINVASVEYFKAVTPSALPVKVKVIEVVFLEANGTMVSVHCKKARGMFVRFAILNRISTVEALKSFTGNDGDYSFRPAQSSDLKLVFVRTPVKLENAATSAHQKKGKTSKVTAESLVVVEDGKGFKEEGEAPLKNTRSKGKLSEMKELANEMAAEEIQGLADRVKRRQGRGTNKVGMVTEGGDENKSVHKDQSRPGGEDSKKEDGKRGKATSRKPAIRDSSISKNVVGEVQRKSSRKRKSR